jgi:hypothetical protein
MKDEFKPTTVKIKIGCMKLYKVECSMKVPESGTQISH